jgi:anhydro-N-acetylmuramic acid kinase
MIAVTALGLMSGTSMDAIDIALLKTDGKRIFEFGPIGETPFTPEERALLRGATRRPFRRARHGGARADRETH